MHVRINDASGARTAHGSWCMADACTAFHALPRCMAQYGVTIGVRRVARPSMVGACVGLNLTASFFYFLPSFSQCLTFHGQAHDM
eukprot:366551-Chlamydomonas_euryale.AAC.4